MVTTPWSEVPLPLTEAAELGTKKMMEEHCSVGILVTTDGSITDIPRQDYLDAEQRCIQDMQRTGKPFIVLINSIHPTGAEVQKLRREIIQTYGVGCLAVDCMSLGEQDFAGILTELLRSFPVVTYQFWFPHWVERLELDHMLKKELYETIRKAFGKTQYMRDAESAMEELGILETVQGYRIADMNLGDGTVQCVLDFPDALFYEILSEKSGLEVTDDGDLMALLQKLSAVKKEYDQIASALEEVRATGYGVVMPTLDQMQLEKPEIIHKNGNYGVRLRASAPSIHMMRADIQAEISPIVGDEKQSEDLLRYLMGESEGSTEKLWGSNIFGKSVSELVNESLSAKMHRLPESTRMKLRDTLSRMINEGCTGLICLMF